MLKRNPCLKHCRMVLKIWKKYWLITAHLNFNFWYCKPILKAIQGQKLEISCSKWTFCHMLEHSKLFSSPFSPAQHNCWERGVFQHVAHLLGTGFYFFLKVNEGNYKNYKKKIRFEGKKQKIWQTTVIFSWILGQTEIITVKALTDSCGQRSNINLFFHYKKENRATLVLGNKLLVESSYTDQESANSI